ncbi:MAG TPA: HEAT repeat domain-containing protein [Candidatus Bilamarchaeum sp.]|nr:HEAT repeat domain-containing protein [Candidatus Bilamarchaeum sp.]
MAQVIMRRNIVEDAITNLRSPDFETRRSALNTIQMYLFPNSPMDGQLTGDRETRARAVQALIGALQRDSRPEIREAAANAMRFVKAPEVLPALRSAAAHDSSEQVRNTAQETLRQIEIASVPRRQ